MSTRERLYGDHDPYEHVRHGPHSNPQMPKGWGADDTIFEALVTETHPELIVEVGSWLGASAIRMANLTETIGTEIICVDTWLGWPDCWADGGRHLLRLMDGFPWIFEEFIHNVVAWGHQDRVTPCPMTSHAGLRWLKDKVKPDLVYIDGSHEYEDVRIDIGLAIELSPKVVFGHDCDERHPGVVAAVEFWRSRGFDIETVREFWIWRAP